jgi:intracellular sulfur oxidation DsrE/DsrF family protein
MQELNQPNPRRDFLGAVATSAVVGLAAMANPFSALAGMEKVADPSELDKWFDKINGKHRSVFDSPHPHEIFPFAWPRVFLISNEATGTTAKDCSVVVVLRHSSICYAFENYLWEKYNFGEHFKANIPSTKEPAKTNPFWKPAEGTYKIPGVGVIKIGINELQDDGVLFAVCGAAINVNSAVVAQKMGLQHEDVKKDWMNGLLPGMQVMPSGVWALSRAQEHKCAYIFAG